MAVLRDLKRRIKSVRNTSQITKAMEVVSATKMRRSQGVALAGRPYALAALDILKNVSVRVREKPALLESRPVRHTLLLTCTSDKGLAGAFNVNTLRLAEHWIRDFKKKSFSVAVVGKKAREYFLTRCVTPIKVFTGFGDYAKMEDTEPLARFILKGYEDRRWDRVLVCYTNFRTTLKQEARMVEVLPIHIDRIEETIKGITPEYGKYALPREAAETAHAYEYQFEPSPAKVFERLLPTLFSIQMHHIVLESNASEHSARMVAMKNASESAHDLMGALSIQYNKSRQSGITREIIEITSGVEALNG